MLELPQSCGVKTAFPVIPLGDNLYARRLDEYDNARIMQVSPLLRDRQGLRARVVAVGPGAPLPDGSAAPMSVRVGDVIVIGRTTGIDARFGTADDVVILRESDVLAVLTYD
jgi:chaperonin GroES